jgi:hypothetical protein
VARMSASDSYRPVSNGGRIGLGVLIYFEQCLLMTLARVRLASD